MKTSCRLDYARIARASEHGIHLLVRLVAPDAAGPQRPPLNFGLVLDSSGSIGNAANGNMCFLRSRIASGSLFLGFG